MSRLRSVAVVALLWVAAVAGSSAPDGFGGPRRVDMPLLAGTIAPAHARDRSDGAMKGKRWVQLAEPDGKRWDLADEKVGRRWA